MARRKLNREPLEQKIIEYIQKDRHPLEIFADRDYYLAGADETWNEAYKRIENMPNYELVGIYNNIIAEENGEHFDSYYDVFRWDYLETGGINMDWLKEKWIEDGCQVSEPYDDVAEDMERQHESILALERTLDEMLRK